MSKNILVLLGLAVIIVGGYFLMSSHASKNMKMEEKAMMEKKAMEEKAMMEKTETAEVADPSMKKDGEMMKKDDAMMAKPVETSMMQKGSYELYDASKLVRAEKGDVVLFFRASWCPFCKATDADIKANRDSISDGLTILEVDYDNSTDLKQKYGLTYQHTFVQVDSKGGLITKWSGTDTLAALEAKVQ